MGVGGKTGRLSKNVMSRLAAVRSDKRGLPRTGALAEDKTIDWVICGGDRRNGKN